MSRVPWHEVEELFHGASALPVGERVRFLEERCRDARVRAEVESLLRVQGGAGEFLSRMPTSVGNAAVEALQHSSADGGVRNPMLGFRLGRYTISGMLGVGGMGTVYRAEQDNPHRTVALKVIRAILMDAEMLRRFRHEAEALGRLRHPGIAQIFEAGSAPGPDGRDLPFFAMELVEGKPLLEFAAGAKLSVPERVALLARTCDAVHHAHQKGVIHRDLKPGNILVEENDPPTGTANRPPESGTGTSRLSTLTGTLAAGYHPKILDFGVARLADAEGGGGAATMRTDPGQVVGTLAYMSPEQVQGRTDAIDTRTDVYALGVILYELLCGKFPYPVQGKPIAETALLITRHDPAPPSAHDRALRGDLDTIVLKALAKEPLQRYQSAAELGADLRRFLADLPVIARPASTAYQIRKFARRHRALVAGIVGIMLALTAGIVGTTIGLFRARAAQKLAQERETSATIGARKAARSLEFLLGMLTAADPDVGAGREVTVREILDQAAARVGEELKDEPEIHLAARDAIARTYRAIGDADKAGAHFQVALDLTRALHGEGSVPEADVLHQLARVEEDRHNWRGILELAERALKTYEAQLPADDLRIVRVCGTIANAHVAMNELDQGERFARRGYDSATARDSREDIATTAGMLANIMQRKGGPTASAEGEALMRLQVRILTELHGPAHSLTVQAKEELGGYLGAEQRDAEAVPILEEAVAGMKALYGPKHRRTLHALLYLVGALQDVGEMTRAEEVAKESVDGLRETAPGGSELGSALWRLGILTYRRKDYAGAEALFRECLELRLKLGDPRASGTMSQLAGALENQGKLDDALEMQRRAVQHRRDSGALMSDFGTLLNNLAVTLDKCGKKEEAEQVFRESIAYDKQVRAGNPLNGFNLRVFAGFLHRQGRSAEAEPLAREAYELVRAQNKQERVRTGNVLIAVLEAGGKAEEAKAIKEELAAIPEPAPKPAPR